MMNVFSRTAVAVAASLAVLAGAGIAGLAAGTESDIEAHRLAVVKAAAAAPSAAPSARQIAELPAPVQRYVAFAFRGAVPQLSHVEIEMDGRFRRPKSRGFTPTRANQTIAAGTPALVFDATTPLLPGVPGLWARAYDAYVNGRMEMKAKILSAFAVVDETSSPELDRISLRRWLLESPLYPVALLPGGGVRWEPIDEHRARAVASFNGMTASMVATFADDGRLLRFDAEGDGDLGTPYHGSGEHVARSDYQPLGGMMIPMKFTIARAAAGKLYPFWEGRVTKIRFLAEGAVPVAVVTSRGD